MRSHSRVFIDPGAGLGKAMRVTQGGTSDARFITHYCPVVEFGLVGQTMHQVDERVPVADLQKLTGIYRKIIDRYFA